MTDSCKDCKFWHSSGLRKERAVGTCRIRSTPGGFPPRYADEWCGEHVQLETKKTAKPDKTVVRRKADATETPATEVANG